MSAPDAYLFDQFRLDPAEECVRRGGEAIDLRPKSFAVLRYLVARAGRLATKEELLETVWADIAVGDAVLTGCIQEIRQALGDNPQSPRLIQTVHRRGYRFIAPVTAVGRHAGGGTTAPATELDAGTFAGRQSELGELERWIGQAMSGDRQIVLVSGEAGIGKTSLVAASLRRAASASALRVAQGQCVEHFGAGEPYLPLLVALGRLCREPGGRGLISLLAHHAPNWLAQMPGLLGPAELAALQPRIQGASRERMLREMADAMEALTADQPLALWIEDLHWSDHSTLDLITLLARRREPAKLLLIGTYRPVDVIVSGHPLKAVKQELLQQRLAKELVVEALGEDAVAQYLARRFPGATAGGAPGRPRSCSRPIASPAAACSFAASSPAPSPISTRRLPSPTRGPSAPPSGRPGSTRRWPRAASPPGTCRCSAIRIGRRRETRRPWRWRAPCPTPTRWGRR